VANNTLLDAVEAKKSDLQKKVTCFKTQVILDNLQDSFVPDKDPKHQGMHGRDKDTGNLDTESMKVDYSDLIGKLVASAGSQADKCIRSILGGVIRGISIASLQNEVIAEVVSAMAGTLAKKVVENVTYLALTGFIGGTSSPDSKRAVLDLLSQNT
jgi:hypothetical protein